MPNRNKLAALLSFFSFLSLFTLPAGAAQSEQASDEDHREQHAPTASPSPSPSPASAQKPTPVPIAAPTQIATPSSALSSSAAQTNINTGPADREIDKALQQAFEEANQYFQARRYASTLNCLEKSLPHFNGLSLNDQQRFKLSRLFLLRANTQRIVRQYKEALQSFDNCLELDPQCIEALCFKGFSLCRLNRKEEARQNLLSAQTLLVEESYQLKLQSLVKEALEELQGEHPEKITRADDLIKPVTAVVPGDHFILYGTISLPALKRYAALAEAFYHFVDSQLIHLEGDYPAGVFLFQDKYEARKFLQQRLNFHKDVLGAFLSESNLIVCYQDKDIGVFLHELSHKLFFPLQNLEYWAEEGIPASFEKAYGYFQIEDKTNNETLALKFGYPELPDFKFDPRMFLHSIPGLRSHFANPRKPPALSAIVKLSPHTNADYQTLQRFVACFLIENKLLPRYLALTLSKNKRNYSSYVEAAFNQSFLQLDKRFQSWVSPYYTRGSKERAFIDSLPTSNITETKEQFDNLGLK